ncbi:MAG: dihydroorotate dehydrogenase electron transfer subunit [Planctomycetes bacterium]|nr:dihydroorotate dehydrogenase electron transfer subunit [Planctomycetota bacterium]
MASLEQTSALFRSTVIRRRSVSVEHFEITLAVNGFPAAAPGQFIQLLHHEPHAFEMNQGDANLIQFNTDTISENPLLRRPFSIGALRRSGDQTEIDIIGRVIGIGTAWLDALRVGNSVDFIGPLGTPFRLPPKNARAILVAGGVGLPPIRWLGMTLTDMGVDCRAIIGAQRRELLPVIIKQKPTNFAEFQHILGDFEPHPVHVIVTTDDGSFGMKGRVTDALAPILCGTTEGELVQVFACGPEPMLKAVGELCEASNVSCQLAMERVMGCGMGTCQSCVVPVKDDAASDGWRYALCCREGPVFDSRVVIW